MAAARVGAAQSERMRQHRGRPFDHEHKRRGDAQKDQQRRRHQEREAIGFFEREILGHHFADHHVHEADDQERERERAAVQPGSGARASSLDGTKLRRILYTVSSPAQPRPRLASVTPTCVTLSKRPGFASSPRAARAATLPVLRELL